MQRPSIAGHRAPSSALGCTHAPHPPEQAPSGVLPRRGQAIKARGVAPAPADAAGRLRSIRSARACHAKCKRPRESQPSGQALSAPAQTSFQGSANLARLTWKTSGEERGGNNMGTERNFGLTHGLHNVGGCAPSQAGLLPASKTGGAHQSAA